MTDFSKLLKYATTDKQKAIVNAMAETDGKYRAAAKIAKTSHSYISETIARLKVKASSKGVDPEHGLNREAGHAFLLDGHSDYVNEETGEVVRRWYKYNRDKQKQDEDLREYVDGLLTFKPAKPKKAKKKQYDSDLMSAIFIGDGHIGMKAWAQETRHSNFDTDIAEQMLTDAIDDLVERAPEAETGLLVDVGDFEHANSSHNTTFNGTPVDVDTRQGKTMRTAAEVMAYAIDRMLDKFKQVVVVVARGNHNPDVALAVQLILEFYYKREQRVIILPTDGFFHYIEWGNWLFGINHGDKLKPQKLVSVMARDMAQAWGRTTHRMWCLGHFHHQNELELDGCIVRKFGTLTPPDSWHASMGFGSGQVMEMITFKKQGGKHSTYLYELEQPVNEPDIKIKSGVA